MFAKSNEHMPPNANTEAGYFFGKPTKYGVADPIPISTALTYPRQMIDHGYHDGRMAIARFDVSDWPAAQHNIAASAINAAGQSIRLVAQNSPLYWGPGPRAMPRLPAHRKA